MSLYLYQAIALTPGETYQVSFDYETDADVATGAMYAGFGVIAELEAQTDVTALANAIFADFSVGPNESGTKSFQLIAGTGQTALFFTNNISAGTITFDNVSLKATNSLTNSGYLENTTSTPINLSQVENQSSLFIYSYLPSGDAINSITLRWGSSVSDYWFSTVFLNQSGNAFENGWNLLEFPWANASSVGSPDASNITYLRVTWNYNGELQTGVRLNGINSILGTVLAYQYYSKYLFRDAETGAFQETVTDDSNLINLDTESYNLLFNLVAFFAGQQQQGADALGYDGNFFKDQYMKALAQYKAMYKSEVQKPQSTYYLKPDKSYRRFTGPGSNN